MTIEIDRNSGFTDTHEKWWIFPSFSGCGPDSRTGLGNPWWHPRWVPNVEATGALLDHDDYCS